jgi:hypothetical protein
MENNNCLLLIVTIPGWRWIVCREEAGSTSRRRCWASRPLCWDCGARRCDLGVALGCPPQPTRYLLDHVSRVRPRRCRLVFVDRGDMRWDFLGVGPHHLQSIPCYADRSRESGGLLPLWDQSLRHQKQGIQWSLACHRGGDDAAAYLYAILLYRDDGGTSADDTAKWYMRRVAGGGSTTSIWLSNEGCLPLREKAARALHYSTWHIWGEPLQPPAHVHGDQPCAGNGGVEKGWL